MAIIADVPAVHSGENQARALFTLSVLTGVVILAAGFLRLGSVLRYVSNTGMTGFISAVGVNIILGQLANLTGYKAVGANHVIRAINTVIHAGRRPRAVSPLIHPPPQSLAGIASPPGLDGADADPQLSSLGMLPRRQDPGRRVVLRARRRIRRGIRRQAHLHLHHVPFPLPRRRQHILRQAVQQPERLADRQSVTIPSEDPDYGDLGQAFPSWRRPARGAILQPPEPEIPPSPQILQRAMDRDADWEAAG